jgi:hypothetical protein
LGFNVYGFVFGLQGGKFREVPFVLKLNTQSPTACNWSCDVSAGLNKSSRSDGVTCKVAVYTAVSVTNVLSRATIKASQKESAVWTEEMGG